MKYCTYLTIYYGNKLPIFYIGYSSYKKILNGYHGTVSSKKYKKIWDYEIKNNLNLFKTRILTFHETKNEAKLKETHFQKSFNVHKNPLYINMSVQGEKFICEGHSEETRKKISKSQIGRNPPIQKGSNISEKHKENISKGLKGKKHTKEQIEKRANSRRGKKNKNPMPISGILKGIETMKKIRTEEWLKKFADNLSGDKNPFFGKTHSEESKNKMKNTDRTYLKESFWWNNGKESKRCCESPGENWKKGRINLKNEHAKGSFWWNNRDETKKCRECPGDGWVRGRLNIKSFL